MTANKDVITGMLISLRLAEKAAGVPPVGIYQHTKDDGAEDFQKQADDIIAAVQSLMRAGK